MNSKIRNVKRLAIPAVMAGVAAVALVSAGAGSVAMYGNTPSRNMVSGEKNVPSEWDPQTGLNIKWRARLGSQAYAGPLVAGGKVYVGTNNEAQYNPKLDGDRGNLMAFDAKTGELVWQSAHPKLPAGRVNDWPLQGVCSTPAVDGDRVYYVANTAEVICADTEGFRDGENDGPFQDESERKKTETTDACLAKIEETGEGDEADCWGKLVKQDAIDEDVVWKYDMIGELDVFPHNLAAGSPLLVGDLLFTVTGQGVDEGHVNIPSPRAPSFIALNKNTGELVWENALPGNKILHGSWSNPAYAVIGGKAQVLFPGGDGVLYSFEPESGKLIWKFQLNPKDSVWELGGRGTRNNVIATPVVHDGLIYLGVGQDPEHGEGHGNFWAIDAAGKTGDITDTAVVWHVGGEAFGRTMSSAAVHDGLLYIADLSGFVYCFDAKTGQHHWTYDAFAAIWGSPFYADGKIYIGDEDGDVAVLKAGKGKDGEPEVLHEINMGAAVYTTPVVHDGVLYVVSRRELFAIENGIAPKRGSAAKGG